MLWSKPEIARIVDGGATENGIDPALICSVVDVLSDWNPARLEQSLDPQQFNPALAQQIGPEQRLGLLQFTRAQAQELGFKETQEELLAPTLNVRIGCLVLKKALAQTGGEAGRALLLCHGYSIASLIPKILNKVKMYRVFLAARPE